MQSQRVTRCPACDGPLETTGLTCGECGTRLEGRFPTGALSRLSPEQQAFIETFVLCRGVIRDVERALDISYPTVRARLDAVVEALQKELDAGQAELTGSEKARRRREILRQVEAGKLAPAEAARQLQKL